MVVSFIPYFWIKDEDKEDSDFLEPQDDESDL